MRKLVIVCHDFDVEAELLEKLRPNTCNTTNMEEEARMADLLVF